MIDTDKYEGHLLYLKYELWELTDFMEINATHEERCATSALLNDALLLLEEVERLRGLLNMIVDKALHEVNTQPNGDDSPYNTILNIAYEGVIE